MALAYSCPMTSFPKFLAGFVIGVTAVCILGPLWYWALVGMSDNVAAAWFWTDLLLGLASVAAANEADL